MELRPMVRRAAPPAPSKLGRLGMELRPMLGLAAPLALAELGWMAMGFVDIVMAGRLGPAAIGAGSLGNMLFFPIAICGSGMLMGLDTLVAQAFGARDAADCRRSLFNGLWLAVALSPAVSLALFGALAAVAAAGTNPAVFALLVPYVKALLWGVPPLLVFTAFRRYLQAMNIARPVTFAVVSANLVNAAGNWALMFGHWGAPRLGLEGSGWSTTFSRWYIAAVLLAAVLWNERKSGWLLLHVERRPDMARIRRLLALGVPSALQILIEGAVFTVVTVMAARLDEVSLAAHSVAVSVVSTTYMVPLGISSAAAVRVGHAVGRKDPHGAAVSGWAALMLGAVFMGSAGVALALAPRAIMRLYTGDAAVVAGGVILLRLAALFQLFDGFQVVAMGALRGLGDTRSPMLANLLGYWAIGMPITWVLCFRSGWGAAGIWVGLSASLILIGSALVVVWARRSARI
jgi:multidrug resistance protein, MATE family